MGLGMRLGVGTGPAGPVLAGPLLLLCCSVAKPSNEGMKKQIAVNKSMNACA